MAQDIRKLLNKDTSTSEHILPEGHKERFESKLEQEFPHQKNKLFFFMKIAAAGILFLGISYFFFQQTYIDNSIPIASEEKQGTNTEPEIKFTLGDLSPEFQKIENYYLTGINMKLTGLQVTEENKEFLEGYMQRLQHLDTEYNELNKELNTLGPNEQTIAALIDNLKLRLDMLIQLQDKLHQFKQSKNEQNTRQQA